MAELVEKHPPTMVLGQCGGRAHDDIQHRIAVTEGHPGAAGRKWSAHDPDSPPAERGEPVQGVGVGTGTVQPVPAEECPR